MAMQVKELAPSLVMVSGTHMAEDHPETVLPSIHARAYVLTYTCEKLSKIQCEESSVIPARGRLRQEDSHKV